jgi:alkaline phosphatase
MINFLLKTTTMAFVFALLASCDDSPSSPDSTEVPPSTPKRIILMIGDGMGLSQITASSIVADSGLTIEKFKHIGLVKTHSTKLITDSAASATAISTGKKTYNGAIGMGPKLDTLKTILEYAEEANWKTGIVTTATVTHATPASFYGHQPSRSKVNRKLAAQFIQKDIEVLMGGGWRYFKDGLDNRDLIVEAQEKGYFVTNKITVGDYTPQKMLCLISDQLPPRIKERGNFLPMATQKSIDILSQKKDNFFLVVEGGQIDWGGHQNNGNYIIEETLDFDRAVKAALDFAKKDKNTLVLVTADHETGGCSVSKGSLDKKTVTCSFTTDYHTGTMVPIFAYGPGATHFTGVMDNTDIFYKVKSLMNL